MLQEINVLKFLNITKKNIVNSGGEIKENLCLMSQQLEIPGPLKAHAIAGTEGKNNPHSSVLVFNGFFLIPSFSVSTC